MKSVSTAAVLLAFASRLLAEPEDVSHKLEKIRAEHQLPALAAAAVDEGQLVAIGATGRRCIDAEKPVTLNDKWQIGSCTKSMTASVAAMLVEEGKMKWDQTIGQTFQELAPTMESHWCDVTLEELLAHRGGAPHDPPHDLWRIACAQDGKAKDQRWQFVKGILAREPVAPHDKRWIYSDTGYAIAGAMMERVTGKSWESMLRHRLFERLGMNSAGFGPPASPGKLDQPWGHRGDDPHYKPVSPGPGADYPPAIGPAATVHCSIADFARYAAWHVAGARGEAKLLTPESFQKLHTPPEQQEYAMGWAVTKRRWAGGTALMHNGDNTMFYAVMWLGPRENTCFVAATNSDSTDSSQACDDAIRMLINAF